LKKHFYILFFFIAINFIARSVFSQTDTVINGKHYQMVEDTKTTDAVSTNNKKRKSPPVDSTFILKNKKLSYYNNWLTVGGGFQQNLTYRREIGFAGGLDFNFHIKKHYFQMGTMISGEKFGFYDNYEFHLGYGKRYEDKDIHFAGFAGISYSTGFAKVGDSIYIRPFSVPGVYAQVEAVKKITYDVGVGLAFYLDWNQEQAIFGSRFILYFSGAYKGKKFADGKNFD
jgi:hypothetical protein